MRRPFELRSYLIFALVAEIIFVSIVVFMAYYTVTVLKNSPWLMEFVETLFEGLAQKVGHTTPFGMTVRIFVNNFLITIAPLLIFSLQLLPIRGLKVIAVMLSAGVGLFIYIINAVVAGLAIGAMGITTNTSYVTLLLVTMVHGSLELFAMAAGTMFGAYYLYHAVRQPKNPNESRFHLYLHRGQDLILRLVPILMAILITAAIVEVYISMSLAERIIGG